MTSINALPRAILQGVQDNSPVQPVLAPEQLPQHLPWLLVLAQQGPTTPQVVDATAANTIYGTQTFNPLSPYATHQTIGANTIMATGNSVMLQRLETPNSATAMLRVSVEVIPTMVPVYARASDGSIEYTPLTNQQIASGMAPTPVIASTVVGTRMVFHTGVSAYTGGAQNFGMASIVGSYRAGTITTTDGTLTKLGEVTAPVYAYGELYEVLTVHPSSALYPLFDLPLSSFGNWGNGVGLQIQAPTVHDPVPLDLSTAEAVSAYLYNLTVVQLNSATGNAVPTMTNQGAQQITGTFKSGVINPTTTQHLSLADTFISSYVQNSSPSVPTVQGPFGDMYIYQSNWDTVLTMLTQGYTATAQFNDRPVTFAVSGEGSFDTAAAVFGRTNKASFAGSTANNYLLNIFTGIDQNRVPYFSFDVNNSVYFGGVSFGNNATQYANGGDDGLYLDSSGHPQTLTNLSLFDSLVAEQMNNFTNLPTPMLDMAMMPISAVWDTGFSIETKKSLLVPVGARKDIYAFLSTQALADVDFTQEPDVGMPTPFAWQVPNSAAAELSIATSLYSAAQTYPESTVYGTSVCRASIIGRCGKLVPGTANSQYTGYLPLTIDVAQKVAKYMGGGDGKWKNGERFDRDGANNVAMFTMSTVNLSYLPQPAAASEYLAGLTWPQSRTRQTLFYPAFRTVYSNDSSVLTSMVTTLATTYLQKVAFRSWQSITGETEYTDAQLIKQSNDIISLAVEGIFDKRFTIIPVTTVTKLDNAQGYSWTCVIKIYANNMRTVGTFTIQSQRASSLSAAA